MTTTFLYSRHYPDTGGKATPHDSLTLALETAIFDRRQCPAVEKQVISLRGEPVFKQSEIESIRGHRGMLDAVNGKRTLVDGILAYTDADDGLLVGEVAA